MNDETLKRIFELRDYCEKLRVFNIFSEVSPSFANTVEIKLVHKLPNSLRYRTYNKILGMEYFEDFPADAAKDAVRNMAYGFICEELRDE